LCRHNVGGRAERRIKQTHLNGLHTPWRHFDTQKTDPAFSDGFGFLAHGNRDTGHGEIATSPSDFVEAEAPICASRRHIDPRQNFVRFERRGIKPLKECARRDAALTLHRRRDNLGVEASGGTPADAKAFMASEVEKWAPIIKAAKISF